MVEGREALFDRGGDGAQDEYHRQVHPAHQTSAQHSRLLVKAGNVTSNGVKCFVGPRNREELLPPPGGDIRDIEAKDEGERNLVEECIEVLDDAFKKPETKLFVTLCTIVCYSTVKHGRGLLISISKQKNVRSRFLQFLLSSHEFPVHNSEQCEDNQEK